MSVPKWQLQTPVSAFIFDCDGTLSTIEGIDILAQNRGISDKVSALTAEAMGKSGLNPEVYQKRLDLVFPQQKEVLALGHQYFKHQVHDVKNIIQLLTRLNKTIYLISAGLYPAIKIFGQLLEIPSENIFAVNIHFDAHGDFIDYERTSPLIHNDGKRQIITQLKKL